MINNTIQKIQKIDTIEQYLSDQQCNGLLRFLTCGSVDDGKSTLIGRLLYDTHHVYGDQLSALYRDSKRFSNHYNNELNLALIVDGLQDERSQGITIDVAYRYFSTEKRKFIIADTPGHEQYTRNMVTGASTSDLAVLLIDARKGLQEQTKRHTIISILLGIRYFIVLVNKMDLVNYDCNVFRKIEKTYLDFFYQLSEDLSIICIPISALNGDNVIKISNNMSWYDGVTLLDALESIDLSKCKSKELQLLSLRFPVQYVISCPSLDFRGYSGKVASGRIYIGQRVKIFPSEKVSKIDRIVTFDGDYKEACIGQSIAIVLSDNIDVSRGDLITDSNNNEVFHLTRDIQVNVVWMSEQALLVGQTFDIKVACKMSRVRIKRIRYQIDVNNLYYYFVDSLSLNSIGLVDLVLDESLFFDNYFDNRITGGIIFIDILTNKTVGIGMVQKLFISDDCCIDNNIYATNFELALNSLICYYYPHWGARNLSRK